MATADRTATRRKGRRHTTSRVGAKPAPREAAGLSPSDAAWLVLVPSVLLTVGIVYLLGPALGRVIYPAHNPYTYWAEFTATIRPEPDEQARYLLLLTGPLLLSAFGALLAIRGPRLSPRAVRGAVLLSQALLAAFVAFCMVIQLRYSYGYLYSFRRGVSFHREYFTPRTLAVAAALAAAFVALARDERARRRVLAATADTRAWRIGGFLVALTMTCLWLLPGVNSDQSIATAIDAVSYHIEYTMDETFAVLNGMTPLADFTAQYGSLWPFLAALLLSVFGKTLLVFTLVMTGISAISMLAIYDALRRIARSAAFALLLFLPLLATSWFIIRGSHVNRYTMSAYFGTFPLRYAAPLMLAWLTTRRLQRGDGHWDWALFAFAGLAVLNNTDYGIPALGGSIAAILWTSGKPTVRSLARLAASVAAGVAIAVALVSLLTLLRAGTLPQFGRLLDYARMYTLGGFAMLPIPGLFGLHTIIYVTYAGAIVTASVRAISGSGDAPLTGMLAWSGIFGLGSAAYYMGRSHPESLTSTFAAWSFALALLAIVAVQAITARGGRPNLAALLVIFGFSVMTCSLAQLPLPWQQFERLNGEHASATPFIRDLPEPFQPRDNVRWFFSSTAYDGKLYIKKGAPILNLTTGGHRVSEAYGVRDVSRYTGTSIAGPRILRTVLDDLRRAGGNTLFIAIPSAEQMRVLLRSGFMPVTARGIATRLETVSVVSAPYAGRPITKWVNTRNPRPRYLEHGRGEPMPFEP
jgi:hypothetical protein